MNTCYVTTSIPYVNARPHVGFALELAQADVIARWRRLKGQDTFFLTGTDENAIKNVQVAAREGITPRELCDRNAVFYHRLAGALNASVDNFIRTSSKPHHRGTSRFWTACRKEDIYLKRYQGLYCVGCEDFYLEKDLQDGRCPTHGTQPETVEEENYFFRLSAYQDRLQGLIESGKLRILPDARRNETLGFIRQGLRDFSISRIRERSGGWGVPVPGDPSQILYVWFDALSNYITGLGYGHDGEGFRRYWLGGTQKAHVIGKDILRFHAVYWPAMLLSAGLPLPETVLVHGFLTVEGQKISKSLDNAVDPFPFIEQYGADALRYYLLRAIPSGSDGDFSEGRFREIYTADLANGLGNLVRRLEVLCQRSGYQIQDKPCCALPAGIEEAVEGFQFHTALQILWDRVRCLNREIEAVRPWDLLKAGQNAELTRHLWAWVRDIRTIAHALSPFLPETAEKILAQFLPGRVAPGEPLFPRPT